MKFMVVGSGGREHSLVWKLAQSNLVETVIAAPGSDAMSDLADCRPVKADDVPGLVALAKEEEVDLVVVGPEAPLCLGLADELTKAGIKVFGPEKGAAELEGSKVFAKEFMARHNIPTAPYAVFDDPERARHYIQVHPGPVVVKADGLAAGKGVYVCDEAKEGVKAMEEVLIHRTFGEAGDRVVIEDRLSGEEASFIVATDGQDVVVFPSSQDHKAAYDGDSGPNTGGMGAYSPAPVVDEALAAEVMETIIRPTLRGLKVEGRSFVGFLYAGLMITADGPKVLEFNVRMGDPEAQPLLARMRSDLAEMCLAAAEGRLGDYRPDWDERAAVCVVMAAHGYPGAYDKGDKIKGLKQAAALEGVMVFHAGTKLDGGRYATNGGRVLGVTALGQGIGQAIDQAYKAVAAINWNEVHFRKDIGQKALNRPQAAIVMGSDSDWPNLKAGADKLAGLGIPFEVKVLSAHRTPEAAAAFSRSAKVRGLKVIIAAAGGAAHLAGAMAAHTSLPVIGIPIAATPLGGLDALLATVQMPPGVPVATVSMDKWGAINAAVLAAQIIALSDAELAKRLAVDKAAGADKAAKGQAKIDAELKGD